MAAGGQTLTTRTKIAVLMTLDSKFEVALEFCSMLRLVGGTPAVIDLSLRPHENTTDEFEILSPLSDSPQLDLSNPNRQELSLLSRGDAADVMIKAGQTLLEHCFSNTRIEGVIGIGGANGSTVACAMMRALPALVPKAMVTPVAATAAVQWYVAQSDIIMFPTIGDISLNRITRAILRNAANAIVGMVRGCEKRSTQPYSAKALIGVSSFGNLQKSVDRITANLEQKGHEVIHLHASGPGGRALESLVAAGELQAVIDLTTSELADFVTGGVYSAGEDRLKSAAQHGIAQIVVPGCLDFSNWWFGEVPDRFHNREFYRYNKEILLMRTNAEEFQSLAEIFVERLSEAKGPYKVLIPLRGFSQMTDRQTQDIQGEVVGRWHQPETDMIFVRQLKNKLGPQRVNTLDLHINDPEFSDRCVAELEFLMSQ